MILTGLFFIVAVGLLSYWMFPTVKSTGSMFLLLWLLLGALCAGVYFSLDVLGWLIIMLFIDLYLLFYSQTYHNFKIFVGLEIIVFVSSCLFSSITTWDIFPIFFFLGMYTVLLILKARTKPLHLCMIILMISIFLYLGMCGYEILTNITTILLFIVLESLYRTYETSFHHDTEDFQNQILSHQYEEIKSVYLNMRGWKHDYHNHIQAMKAYVQLHQFEQLSTYLGELETDLKRVDQLIKSGNLMMDAILNSKLSLAMDHHIAVTCKAVTPEKLSIADIDICVMIGNLLDNAIEACTKTPMEDRKIRIYTDIVHQQFYFSITNNALENLSVEQTHYISDKRGNHGHGMKRVKLTVDKYDGFLNLKNEAGVFVSELMIPLK